MDPGYRGAPVQPGTKVYHHKLKRDITARLRRDIRRLSAIVLAIGHMKNDSRLRRNWLKARMEMHFIPCYAAAATTRA